MKKRRARPAEQRHGIAADACEHYHADLHRFLMWRLRNAHAAQELAQEAYLRLLRVERSELIRKPRAYLYRIALNLVYELRLKEQRELVTFDSEMLDGLADKIGSGALDDPDERAADQQQIEVILEQLPPLYRAIFVLRKRDGLSYPEIAQQLDISVHTVKKYLARAVAMCRNARWRE